MLTQLFDDTSLTTTDKKDFSIMFVLLFVVALFFATTMMLDALTPTMPQHDSVTDSTYVLIQQ